MNLQLSCYEAERGLLRIFCQHIEVLGLIEDSVIPEYFMDINRIIFLAIKELYSSKFTIDIITIKHTLERLKDGNRVPESSVLDLFTTEDKDKAETYLAILVENYQARNYQSMVIEISGALKDRKSSGVIAEIIGKYASNITLGASRPKSLEVVVEKYEQEITEDILHGNDRDKRLLSFGVSEIDRVDAMRPGNLYTIAGRPGSGKTSMVIQTAYHNAFIKKKRVLLFSLEMQEFEILEKFYCRHTGINSDTWLKMNLKVKLKEMQKFKAYIVAQGIDLIIDDQCTNLDSMISRINALMSQKHIELVCIDYIQLISAENSRKSRNEEIETIMNTLKNKTATEHKTVVILLSQLSKSLEKEGSRLPVLADLLASGAIEATSTSVYFLHRVDEIARAYFDDQGTVKNNGETMVLIKKARYGKTGEVLTWFIGGVNIFVKTKQEHDEVIKRMNLKCQQMLERTE